MARINRPVSRRQAGWLLATAVAAVLPLSIHLPIWLSFVAAGGFLWRGALNWRQWHLPRRWSLTLLVALGTAGVFLEFRSVFGRTPGVSLLVVFLTLKLLELRTARDAIVVALLCYFLVLGQFLFTQTIPSALAAGLTLVMTTAGLLAASDDRPTPTAQLRRAGLMLAQALPIMLILFILFPRINGPLWGIPADRYAAISGLSDTISPGSVAQLTQSDAVAFRVKFSGTVPSSDNLYWRGPVMTAFDGRSWRASETQGTHLTPPYPTRGQAIDYEVTLEPHGKFWLFALELPGTLPTNSALTNDYQPIAREAVRTRVRYTQRAWPEAIAGQDEVLSQLRESLKLPRSGNPRIRAVAENWRTQYGKDSAAIFAAAEKFFGDQLLTYTLNPPLLGSDVIDEFLFDTKRGFCEHFATSFVFALRAAGVPARVVAGYQGGEINPVDGFLVVRQYDAHAWAEVWIAGRGWVRIDPTAISAPQRVANGAAASVPAGESSTFRLGANSVWLRELRNQLDAVTNGWNQWVLGYNPQRQRDLLLNLGLGDPDWRNMTAILTGLLGAVMLLATAWVLRSRVRTDPALAAWRRFTARLSKGGIHWQPWEGPLAYAARAAQHFPAHAATITDIATHYARLRYAANPQPHDFLQLKAKINAFRP